MAEAGRDAQPPPLTPLDPATALALADLPAGIRRAVLSRSGLADGTPGAAPLYQVLSAALSPDPSEGRRLADEALAAARRALAAAGNRGDEALPLGARGYPACLAAIPDPPLLLWLRGSADALAGPAVAIVGSRAASPYALEMAGRLAADLARLGVVIVSGLARGVDAAAHAGALSAGRTVAVLGCGITRVYPAEHAELARRIAQAGAVVTELAPGSPPLPSHFPRRNRLISGLSLAIVIVEASERSGSLITARCALEQGRDVMVVPGSALAGRNRGGHALVKDGARLVESAAEIVEEIRPMTGGAGAGEALASTGAEDEAAGGRLPPAAGVILEAIPAGEAVDLDTLAARTGIEARVLLPQMLSLELEGRLFRAGGGRFVRARRS